MFHVTSDMHSLRPTFNVFSHKEKNNEKSSKKCKTVTEKYHSNEWKE